MRRAEPRAVHGLILAAGASSRMGRPKALLPLHGHTFLAELAGRLRAGGCARVRVTGGAHARQIAAACPFAVDFVEVEDWPRGMRASLRAGLRGLPLGPVILTHVDRPLVAPSTVRQLVTATDRSPLVPTWHGRPGHPVRLPSWLRERLLWGDDVPLRAILEQSGARRIPVGDPTVVANVNTPADLARLRTTCTESGRA